MKLNKRLMKTRSYAVFGAIFALTLVNVLFGLAWPPLVTRAGPTAPPRDPTPSRPDKDDEDKSTGAYLELQVQPPQAGLWTVVQWQDSAGGWQNVEGWQGALDEGGKKVWWVEAKDFGKGPFRWVVATQRNEVLAESDSFYLPQTAGEIITVTILLSPMDP